MPTPNKDETHDDWMARCMGDEEHRSTFPDQEQAVAVCQSKWEQYQKEMHGRGSAKLVVRMQSVDVAEMLLYDQIGGDFFFGGGVSAEAFRKELKGLKAKTLNLRINSPGGSVTEASAILAALDGWQGRIEVDVDGLAASAASFIMMAGDEVRVASNALVMIHDPHGSTAGNAADLRRTADLLDKVREQIIDAYSRKSKAGRDQLAAWMAAETWFTGDEAVKAGLADNVTQPRRLAAFSADAAKMLHKLGCKKVPPRLAAATAEHFAETAKRKAALDRLRGGDKKPAPAVQAAAGPLMECPCCKAGMECPMCGWESGDAMMMPGMEPGEGMD